MPVLRGNYIRGSEPHQYPHLLIVLVNARAQYLLVFTLFYGLQYHLLVFLWALLFQHAHPLLLLLGLFKFLLLQPLPLLLFLQYLFVDLGTGAIGRTAFHGEVAPLLDHLEVGLQLVVDHKDSGRVIENAPVVHHTADGAYCFVLVGAESFVYYLMAPHHHTEPVFLQELL